MTSFRVRPRFIIQLDQTPDELTKKFKTASQADFVIEAIPNYVTLKIKNDERHFWSPQLTIILEDDDPSGTIVNGLYGPSGNVWTMFAFGYMALGTLITFISIIGFSQRSLGMEAGILWVLPILVGALIFLYLLSQFGQKLGAEQMFTLHHGAEEILGTRIHIS